jgi:rhodanese-related sulfurtransferase
MARRTVSVGGPSASLQVSGLRCALPGGFQPQEVTIRPTTISTAINRCTPQSLMKAAKLQRVSSNCEGVGRQTAAPTRSRAKPSRACPGASCTPSANAVLDEHGPEVVHRLNYDHDVVLVCRLGQRSAKAAQLLQGAGLTGGRVLERGITDWEGQGFAVDRGVQRWEMERQVRLVAGSIVLSSVVGSVVVPQLKWLAAAIGAGLTYAAVSNTCAMGTALSKLPYNRGATSDAKTILAQLDTPPSANNTAQVGA